MAKVVLGITPARGGSKGIPRKNIKLLSGMPLIAHTILAAQGSELLTDYILNSEDAEIRGVAEDYGAKTMSRPDEYSHDLILQEVDLLLKWTVEQFEALYSKRVDIVVLLYPTAPLRNASDIDKTIDKVLNQGFDSALTLYHDTRYLWSVGEGQIVKANNYDPNKRMPRQKEVWNQWAENKAVYAMKRNVLFQGKRIGENCGFVEMEKLRSVDIDEPDDFKIAESIFRILR